MRHLRLPNRLFYGSIVLLLSVISRAAFAQIVIVDQQNLNTEALFADSTRFSQSFTPSLPSVNAFDVILAAPGGAVTGLQLDLFQGKGVGGTLLAASQTLTLPAGSGPTLVEFKLSTPVTLQPGTIYTFSFGSFGTTFSARYGSDTYAGGQMFDAQFSYPTRDLYFQEGLGVPEPTVSALVILAVLAAIAFRRKPNKSEFSGSTPR